MAWYPGSTRATATCQKRSPGNDPAGVNDRCQRTVSAGPGPPARVPARPLVGDDPALLEDLTAPDAERFCPLDRPRQARPPQRASLAYRLGQLEIGRMLGEPQLPVVATGQRIAQVSGSPSQRGQRDARHVASPP